MFRQRKSSQKPADTLLVNFRQQYPELTTTTSTLPTQPGVALVAAVGNPLVDAPVLDDVNTNLGPGQAFQPDEPTARMINQPWRLASSSFMDTNSFNSNSFANASLGYLTPNGGTSTLFYSEAAERVSSIDSAIHSAVPPMNFQPGPLPGHRTPPPNVEKFRFHSTLSAPTAMVKNPDDIPVTYLNKGQAYNLSITDTHAVLPVAASRKFRTSIRISFEGEEQRQNPGVCWRLWKEGRGANEAHQRGGKLLAVEYVEVGQPVGDDDQRTRVELETSSIDGFSVTWTCESLGVPKVNVRSKGVKGIPVRLCAKTTVVTESSQTPVNQDSEVCFCKVQLFRDHGAERKLSNDVAHVKKSVDKIKHQISQAESGMKEFGIRKRGRVKPKFDTSGADKTPKQKTTWTLSLADSVRGTGRPMPVENMHTKLQAFQDIFSSTRPVSFLFQRGEEQDDPDARPITPAIESKDSNSDPGGDRYLREKRASNADSFEPQSPSFFSMASQQLTRTLGRQYQNFDGQATGEDIQETSERPIKIRKPDHEGKLSGWIEAFGVDQSYRPLPMRMPKPVACFYMLCHDKRDISKTGCYKAIYLFQRSLKDFNLRIAEKFGLDHTKMTRTIHVLQSGIEVEMDDDIVQNLSEGQDMVLEVEDRDRPIRQEWGIAVDDTPTQGTPNAPSTGGLVLRLTF